MTIFEYNAPEPYLHLVKKERKRIIRSGYPTNQKKNILDLLSRIQCQRADFSQQRENAWRERHENVIRANEAFEKEKAYRNSKKEKKKE